MLKFVWTMVLLLAGLPGHASAQEFARIDEAISYINQAISVPPFRREISVLKDSGGVVILFKSQNLKHREINYLYRVRADMLDLAKTQRFPDQTIAVVCKGESYCVGSFEADTGKKIIDFQYLSFGPFPADQKSKRQGEQAVRRLVQLAQAVR